MKITIISSTSPIPANFDPCANFPFRLKIPDDLNPAIDFATPAPRNIFRGAAAHILAQTRKLRSDDTPVVTTPPEQIKTIWHDGVPLVVTEGERAAFILNSNGIPSVALAGHIHVNSIARMVAACRKFESETTRQLPPVTLKDLTDNLLRNERTSTAACNGKDPALDPGKSFTHIDALRAIHHLLEKERPRQLERIQSVLDRTNVFLSSSTDH